ncbi:cysteine-tryptophan domain-containing zinc finger protein 7-like isoform X1 [Carya illinoinensis]|uniref:CW-type domain-containing protein n=2 Tax=Carya illinoinensis TaxID=32201 RepID=A0A8T1RCP1_CARIL|nr:cysteine-tryptophan domain-containing zinc finger protein 7-like isoform X1 [Carya illinoinensis]XP_042967041.1 cysteine-tryptophan domain-containing zinc finger protein 7-like isoform X1 [Carya illinoinensis]XP_042967042.1 cysteine-tryptophan domain-containing zinc finger protein 7-like isoform X1 [Carya illinoinensis]XP_042967043.1 cysteine-tryptophan domain-containing zinc finger protein 7-like isoform X1 [Carya illinoinensis]XP_042967044.1 cysteine-tryptophan domain-containing zinc finge
MVDMEGITELEEGEALYFKDDDDKKIDPDIALSYIDEKIQHVLGHFLKDFEGGVSAENLGAKFGAYGSFLPTYERSPSKWSRPKSPQRNYSAPRSSNDLPIKGVSQNLKAPSNIVPYLRLGTASCSAHQLHNSRVPSADVSIKQSRVAEKSPSKDETFNGPGNRTNQRTLKVRIKVGYDNSGQNNAAIYSGLGLDYSPSSSMGNSLEDSGGTSPISQETVDKSPTSIIWEMTSLPIPRGVLISPLHDSLLCLMSNEKVDSVSKPMPPLKGHQEHSALLLDGSISMTGNKKVLKEKGMKSVGKSERLVELKRRNGTDIEDDTTLEMKKIPVDETMETKELFSGKLKSTQVSKSAFDVCDSVKPAGGASEVSWESNEDVGKDKILSSALVKEESSESISGQERGKSEKRNPRSGLVEKLNGNKVVSSHRDVLINCKDDDNGLIISTSLKGYTDEAKCMEDLNPRKEKVGCKAKFHEDDDVNVPIKTERLSFEGNNKSKGAQSNGKRAAVSTKESLSLLASVEPHDKKSTSYGVTDFNSKVRRKKSQKDNKGKDGLGDSISPINLKEIDNPMDPVGRPCGDRPKDAKLDDFEIQQNVFLDKRKGRSSSKKVDKQSVSGASNKNTSAVCPIAKNGLTSEMAPTMAVPVVIEEHWVQCDRCQKWRLLPYGTKPEQLPDKWLCGMLNWLHGMNRCDISEEETTKALNALYHLPVSENQNNLPNHVTGTALGAAFGDVQHLEESHQNLSSHAISNQVKKKHGFKERANAVTIGGHYKISNSAKNKVQETVKSRSLNGTNQHHVEPNPMKRSSSQALSTLRDLVVEKDMLNQREKPINGAAGDVRKIKMKSKRETDEYGCGTSKKSRTDDMHADKHLTSKMDLGRVHINSSTAMPTMGSGKDIHKYDEFLSEDTKCDVNDKVLESVKKLGYKAQVSSDGGSLGMRVSSKKDASVKKRKMKNQEYNENEIDTFQNSIPDGRVYEKEVSSESGFRKDKKFRFSKNQVKESSTSDADDKSNKKGKMPGIILSDIRDHPVGLQESRRNDKDQQLRKHKKKIALEQTQKVVDSLRRDLGSGQVSVAANSSSSKVSGSYRTRANVEDMKGSPVESVSSSPLKSSNLARGDFADNAGKDDAMNTGLPGTGDFRRCSDGDSNAVMNLAGTVIHSESYKVSALEYMNRDASHQFSGKAKPFSDIGNSHLLNGTVDIVEQNVQFLNDVHAPEHSYDEVQVKKNHCDNAVLQKSGKDTPSRSRGKSSSSMSEFDRDKINVYETTADVKDSSPKNPSIKFAKDEKNHVSHSNSLGQWSGESRIDTKLKEKEHDGSDMKMDAPCRKNGKLGPEQSLIQDFEGESKADSTKRALRNGKSKFLLSYGDGKLEKITLGCGPVPGLQKLDVCPVRAPGDVSKALKDSGNVDNNGVEHSLGHHLPDSQGVRDINASSPVRMISSSQAAINTLKEAKVLRDTADRLKSSCFGFESNEAYFQAALKFLQGASLLETCNGESGRKGEMNPIQAYGTAAKLCELCALQYETRLEMAAAALAYKCLGVAYMRVVYCKHSSISRDRHDLQATLQVVPQGESPSSSASDVDNLNNQTTVDKGSLSKNTASHVAGNQTIAARNRPNFVRLLEFTQDAESAMEAFRKSHNAIAATNVSLEEEQIRDCVTSVKRVLDFSFQDVEELVRLVRIAMEAISRSSFSGARE